MLERVWVYLQVDGTAPGVDLPDWLRTPAVPLQVGYNMPNPIPDLQVDDWGVTCTLSFRRTPHTCRIPWAAIFAFHDGEGGGVVFPEDLPAALIEQAAKELAEAQASEEPGSGPEDTGEAAAAAAVPEPTPAPSTRSQGGQGGGRSGKPRPSHLKLV